VTPRMRADYVRVGRFAVHLLCIVELLGMHRPKRVKHWVRSWTVQAHRYRHTRLGKFVILAALAWETVHLLWEESDYTVVICDG
jgi:hypothetical protein